MEKLFSSKNNVARDKQINFRVSSDEKMSLVLMTSNNIGEFVRNQIASSSELLEFYFKEREQAKKEYDAFLNDLASIPYSDLIEKHTEAYDLAQEKHPKLFLNANLETEELFAPGLMDTIYFERVDFWDYQFKETQKEIKNRVLYDQILLNKFKE